MAERPTGTVTFLFTDIEGSTGRWEEQTDEMRQSLARHDQVLRAAVEAHGGWLFKHTGDGILAAFASPRAAVDAAIEAQRRLDLKVRMGIATGEAELRDNDYFGPTLNRAARIMAAGHGGQILVAPSTAELLEGIDLLALGEHRLRDLSRPQRLFQLRAEGLGDRFPPLRTLDAAPGNLAPQATSFIGRESQLAELLDVVRANRLVTLTGVGGVGKTRLALQLAGELAPEYRDGTWLIELASVGDPDAVPDAVASALGVTQHASKSVAESLADALVGRIRLLVLDNCEHVLKAAGDLVELILARARDVTVVATSREGLGLPAERLWPVPSLEIRDGALSPAATLFIERARALVPSFSAEADPEAVVDICTRLDGIPLAIELAAARMVSMSPAEVRERLRDRFRLLSGSRRGLERHQTLRHAVQWSYDLLDEHERLLLDRCSVFAGGFALEAAVAVGGGTELDEYVVLDLLDSLVRKSLLTVERIGDQTRYGMLETIRQFAEDQLAARRTGDEVRDRHTRYYADQEKEILALWDSPRQRQAHEWLDAEMGNLRAAVRWAIDRDDLDSAASITEFAGWIGWWARRFEPVNWAAELLIHPGIARQRRLPGLHVVASFMAVTGQIDDALRLAGAAQDLLGEQDYDDPPFGYVGWFLAAWNLFAGRTSDALDCMSAEIARTGDPLVLDRASLAHLSVRDDRACQAAAESVAAAERTGNPSSLAWALCVYVQVMELADPHAALAAGRRAVQVSVDSLSRANENVALQFLAPAEGAIGDPVAECDFLARGLSLSMDADNHIGGAAALGRVAIALYRRGHHAEAARLYGTCAANIDPAFVPGVPEAADGLRSAIGPERFKHLATEGAATSVAGAMRQALAHIVGGRELPIVHQLPSAPPAS